MLELMIAQKIRKIILPHLQKNKVPKIELKKTLLDLINEWNKIPLLLKNK